MHKLRFIPSDWHFRTILTILLLIIGWQPSFAIWDDSDPLQGKDLPWHDGSTKVEISTRDQLVSFAYRFRTATNDSEKSMYAKATIVLKADIDLSGNTWRPLGEGAQINFQGTLDGQGHAISYMTTGGAGSYWSGFIDYVTGNVTIKDITFANCTSEFGNYGNSIIVAAINAENTTLTFENIQLKNCKLTCSSDDQGMLLGTVQKNNCTLNMKHITVENCSSTAVHKSGLLLGDAVNSTVNIDDVAIKSSHLIGRKYIGMVCGWLYNNSKSTINNVRIDSDCTLNSQSNWFAGGIAGEIQGIATIRNCVSQVKMSTSQSELGDYSGELVGKIYGSQTKLTVSNCVVADPLYGQQFGQRWAVGCVLGGIGANAVAYIDHVAVCNGSQTSNSEYCGYLVGTNNVHDESGDLHIQNCYVPAILYDGSTRGRNLENKMNSDVFADMLNKSVGVNRNNNRFTHDNIYPYAENLVSENQAYLTALMNESGTRFTLNNDSLYLKLRPLDDNTSDGLVVRYKVVGSKDVTFKDYTTIDYGNRPYGNNGSYIVGQVGREMSYTIEPGSGKWIVADNSTLMGNKQRTGATTFKGLPSAATSDDEERLMQFTTVDNPSISMENSQYIQGAQRVTLSWHVTDSKTLSTYWKNGKWVVYKRRQGTSEWTACDNPIAVSSSASISWTDLSPVPNSIMEYRIELICDDLYYGEGKVGGTNTATVNCDDNVDLSLDYVPDAKGIVLTSHIPNSAHFDGCKMTTYRWSTSQQNSIQENFHLSHPDQTFTDQMLMDSILANADRYSINTGTFAYDPTTTMGYLDVVCNDALSSNPCSELNYIVACTDFQTDVYRGKTLITTRGYYQPDRQVEITDFAASKGESTSKVRLEWKSSLASPTTNVWYTIERKAYDVSDAGKTRSDDTGWSKITDVTNSYTTNTYTDEALPGYVYRYRLRARTTCEDTYSKSVFEEADDMGFAASRGTIMGKIAYNSGATTVEGVDVRLSTDSASLVNATFPTYVRHFMGQDDLLPLATGLGNDFWDGDWTVQFLLRPQANETKCPLLNLPGHAAVEIQDGNLFMAGRQMTIDPTDYNHLMLAHQAGSYKLGYAQSPATTGGDYAHWEISVDDATMQQWLRDNGETAKGDTLYFGRTSAQQSFKGFLDEVRVWGKALTDRQIQKTYDRYLTGNEESLRAYYTFDAGVVEKEFDTSHPAGIWNNHHAVVRNINGEFYPGLDSQNCPSEESLCYRGTTDENGEYQIAGIPFSGEGTNYMVVPVFGTHEFQPAKTRRYVSSQSLSHSDVDFTDASSFPVPVKARYAWGDYPVKDLSVFIDGVAATRDGETIKTNANGECTVDVPIGTHKIVVNCLGHSFVNEGYPCSIDSVSTNGNINFTKLQDDRNLIDFQSAPTAAFTFYDKTMYRLAGRVVGGDEEGKKHLGGGLSKNNIGQVKLTLEPTMKSGYALNSSAARDIQIDGHLASDTIYKTDNINSTTRYLRQSSRIEVLTDKETGEYLAWLPPVDMTVTDIQTIGSKGGQLDKDAFGLGNSPATISYDLNNIKKDTLYADTTGMHLAATDTIPYSLFRYHGKKSYTYYTEPQIEVYNPANIGGLYPQMLGDSVYVNKYTDSFGNRVEETVPLWTDNLDQRDGTSRSYTLDGMPVFTQDARYQFDIKLYESYKNRDSGEDTHYNMSGVDLSITNTLATTTAQVLKTGDDFEYALKTDSASASATSDSDGIVEYEFRAGLPNPLAPYTLDFSISYSTNGKYYTYPQEGTVQGIVLGHVNEPGTDFVTAGPDLVSFVLRDPPGSSSHSWIEQGSSIANTYSWEETGTVENETKSSLIIGTKTESYTLAGTEVIADQEESVTSDAFGSTNVSVGVGGSKETNLKYTVNKKIETGTALGYVGSWGDVYVGSSTNFVYSKCKVLGLRQSEGGTVQGDRQNTYSLDLYDGNSAATQFTTTFQYSQRQIIDVMIPKLREDRYSLVDSLVNSFEGLPNASPLNRPMYYLLKSTDKDKSNWVRGVDYLAVLPSEGYCSDSIQTLTNFITNWEKQIAYNDSIKYNTVSKYHSKLTYSQSVNPTSTYSTSVQYGFMGNVSFDAGAPQENTLTREYTTSKGVTENHSEAIGGGTILEWHAFWLAAGKEYSTDIETKATQSGTEKMGKEESLSQTFGYSLSDDNAGSYYSIDTYLPGYPTGNGTFTELDEGNSTPAFDQFFVFRLRGGQSKCPYQGEEYSSYYKVDGDYAKLGDGTIAIEKPLVSFPKKVYTNVPNGQALNIPFTLANTSTATVIVEPEFGFCPDSGTNPDGLEFYVDGQPVTDAQSYSVYLEPGASVQKTLKVVQSKRDVLDYENINFLLYSECDFYGCYSTDSLTIHFKPISSPVSIKQSTNVINKDNQTLKLTVSDFDKSYDDFKGINVQYKGATDLDWNTYYVLIADSTDGYWTGRMPDDGKWAQLGKDDGRNEVYIDLSGIADGKYLFRAESFSVNGTELITNTSDTVSITKDTLCPDLLNKPSTFYDGTSDIEVQFTEPIDVQALTDSNFKVTGILNDADVTHESGLHFDGTTPAKTNSRVDIFGQNATIGFWYKPQTGKKSCLFSQIVNQGTADAQLYALYYNEDATMTLRMGDKSYTSIRKAVDAEGNADADWMYASLIINRDEQRVSLINLFGTIAVDQSLFLYEDGILVTEDTNVPLYVGGSVYGSGDPCHAEMESMVIYDGAKDIADIASEKDDRHSANTRGLLAYWPMDEGEGSTAKDIVRQRNLILSGTDHWYLPVTNYALHLNGSQYMTVNTSACPISSDEDYVLEFWFRSDGNVTEPKTLFSNGWGGQDSPEADVEDRTSLSLCPEGQILIESYGGKMEVGSGYNDGQWHQLAFNVQRDGYVTLMVDTVVINSSYAIPGNWLGAFENSDMTIGARRYRTDANHYQVDRYFTGMIDEVRIWRAYRTLATVRSCAFSRLDGDEPGLVAYYPFEYSKLVASQKVTYPTLLDRVVEDKQEGIVMAAEPTMVGYQSTDIESLAREATSEDGPRLKAADFISVIDMEWKTNGTDKIVLSFPDNLSKDRIENCTLNMTVQNVRDLVGNRMEQPYTWNVYVAQNPLMWVADKTSLRQQIGSTDELVIVVSNTGSTTQNWSIEDIPAWAHLSQTSGMLKPYSSVTLILTSSEATAIGKYSGVMYLVGNDGIYAPLSLSLSVTSEKPDWEIAQTDGSVWMSLFGRLKINDVWSTDEDDLVGVFAPDGRCLALGSPEYNEDMDTYFLQLSVRGNKEDSNQDLTFQVWDASTGLIYTDVSLTCKSTDEPASTQKFLNKKVLGTFDQPYVISTRQIIRQTISLRQGWNWISMWVKPDEGMNAARILTPVMSSISDVKSRFSPYNADNLSDLTLSLAECYHIYANEPVKFTIEGAIANPDSIEMQFLKPDGDQTYWQWIGFPLTNSKSLAEAFADLPCAKNDVVKSEDNFAMFNGSKWVGDLSYLSPGQGYLYGYNGLTDKNWHYPNKARRKANGEVPFTLDVDPYTYEDYTFVTATVVFGSSLTGHDYQLAAFDASGMCHGVAEAKAGDKFHMAIYGEDGEVYTFRLYDRQTGAVYDLTGNKDFDSETPGQTITFRLNATGIQDAEDTTSGNYYNLGGADQGQRLRQRGVYINGSRKKAYK